MIKLLAALALVLSLAACDLRTPWVVHSTGYHGPKGHGTNYVLCVRQGNENEPWKGREVNISAETADAIHDGDKCPG